VGSSKTLTVEVVFDSASEATNAEVWAEAQVFTNSGVPQSAIVSSRIADVLATPANLTSSSAAWTGTGGFTNEKKRKIELVFTPQEKGYVEVYLHVARASMVVYADLDPAVT
jgi:hypothetical protein